MNNTSNPTSYFLRAGWDATSRMPYYHYGLRGSLHPVYCDRTHSVHDMCTSFYVHSTYRFKSLESRLCDHKFQVVNAFKSKLALVVARWRNKGARSERFIQIHNVIATVIIAQSCCKETPPPPTHQSCDVPRLHQTAALTFSTFIGAWRQDRASVSQTHGGSIVTTFYVGSTNAHALRGSNINAYISA